LSYLLFASQLALVPAQGAAVLGLSPAGGALSGLPGDLVGWGFTLTNPTNFAVVTSVQFCTTVVVTGITVCDQFPDPSFGTFTDFAAQFNFLIAGPAPENPVIVHAFDPLLFTGIGSFAIDPAATGSFAGQILMSYDLYSRSPNDLLFDSGADQISVGNTLTADASVTVVPEPGTWILIAAGLATILRGRRPLTGSPKC